MKELLEESKTVPNAIQMYLKLASEVIQQVELLDGDAADNLRTIINFFVNDTRFASQNTDTLKKDNEQLQEKIQTLEKQKEKKSAEIMHLTQLARELET